MRLFGLLVCFGFVVALTSGCTPQVPKAPPMATVKGMVYLDMKPMKNGEIEFEVIAQPAIMLEVKDGVFEGEVYTGKNTVRVHQYVPGPPASTDPDKKPTKKESLPARYNSQTSLSEDVPEGGKSDLKYHVTSK